MKEQFTKGLEEFVKGPYESICTHKDPDGEVIDECSIGKICVWGGFTIAVISDEVPDDQKQATALFLKAAPDMYEALNKLVEYINYEGPASREWRAITEWVEKSEKALAKARGES